MISDYMRDWNELEWQPHPRFEGAWIKKLITADMNTGVSATLLKLKPGQQLPLHVHDASVETFFLLEGEAVCHVDGDEKKFRPGSFAFPPKGVMHQIRNEGNTDLLLLAVFNPPV